MAAFHGKIGKITWDASTASTTEIDAITSWTLDIICDVADGSDMSAATKTYFAGWKDWTATVESILPTTGSQIPLVDAAGVEALGEKTPAILEMWLDDTGGAGNVVVIHGAAICVGIGYNIDVNDVVKITYNFQGTGALTHATSEPTY